MTKKWIFYLVRCSDNSLYAGITNDPNNRVKKHNYGEGSAYTRKRLPVKLVYQEEYDNKKEALKREKQIKGWRREKKENLIQYGKPKK